MPLEADAAVPLCIRQAMALSTHFEGRGELHAPLVSMTIIGPAGNQPTFTE